MDIWMFAIGSFFKFEKKWKFAGCFLNRREFIIPKQYIWLMQNAQFIMKTCSSSRKCAIYDLKKNSLEMCTSSWKQAIGFSIEFNTPLNRNKKPNVFLIKRIPHKIFSLSNYRTSKKKCVFFWNFFSPMGFFLVSFSNKICFKGGFPKQKNCSHMRAAFQPFRCHCNVFNGKLVFVYLLPYLYLNEFPLWLHSCIYYAYHTHTVYARCFSLSIFTALYITKRECTRWYVGWE